MKKNTVVKKTAVSKLSGFAPKPGIVADPRQAKARDDTPAPVGIGPRGGKTATLADRQIAISFRVSKEQYKKLCEGRLDKLTTTQGLMLLALDSYFRQEWDKAF